MLLQHISVQDVLKHSNEHDVFFIGTLNTRSRTFYLHVHKKGNIAMIAGFLYVVMYFHAILLSELDGI